MTEQNLPVISFKDFSFQYRAQKKPTLTGINLDIYPGERVLIAGPSGSGKSTLAGCINGLNPFSNPGECTGSLIVDGVDAPHSSIFELSAHVGTVLQDPDGQFIGLTVGEDIAFALENSCMPQEQMHSITRHAAELVGIQDHLDYAPHELSGGQKQRVSLAGVMVDQVKILLFDEPLANLDPATGKQAIELIDEIQQKTDTTVLIIEHRLEDVLWKNVDRIVLVNEGKILADLHPDELLSTTLLADNGIREPLYVTAMRYAGIEIVPCKKPSHVNSLLLDQTDQKMLQNWFHQKELSDPSGTPEPLLEIKNLSFGYTRNHPSLKDVTLTIYKGEMVSIVGKNGAGKSTLSAVLTGRERFEVTQGEVEFNGKNLLEMPAEDRAREGIFLSFQYPVEIPGVSTVNFLKTAVNEIRKYHGQPPYPAGDFLKMIRQKMELVGIDNKLLNRSLNEGFSGGEKKKNEIFQMAVLEPKLAILDETDSGLDIDALRTVANGVNKLKKPENATIVITHYQRLLDYIVPDVVHVLYDGRIVKTAGKELVAELEEKGYDWIKEEVKGK